MLLLLFLSSYVFLGRRWTIPASYAFGGFMTLNALGHFAGSLFMGRAMPGVYSSPFLLAASVYLIYRTRS